ncbi:MAG: hypothetical protein Q7S45_04255 [Candidatus Curtissbacteria bacterium]|nr:hypothetical protein [Candidatus Curtissbacteria bacterium]
MPFSAHSDFYVINMFPSLLWRENVVDILSYSRQEVNRPGFSYYPPLTYFTLSVFQFLYQPFSNTFIPWVDQLRSLYVGGFRGTEADYIKLVDNPFIFRDIFLGKTPYLIFDIGCVLALVAFIRRRYIDKKIVLLWLFNPVLLYGAYIFGQFDIIPAFFILLGFLLIDKNPSLGLFTVGIAGAFKNYSFVFIIPLAGIYGRSLKDKAKLALIGFVPSFIFATPTIINSPSDAVFAFFNGIILQSKRPLEGWPLYSQLLRYTALAFSYFSITLLFSLTTIKNKWRLSVGVCCIAILLVLTLVPRTSFHYLFWAFPLIILWFRGFKVCTSILLIQTISFASYKILAPQLQAGLFVPINPDYFHSLPTFNYLLGQIIPYRIISTAGFLIFLSLNLYLIARIIYEITFKSEVSLRKLGRR